MLNLIRNHIYNYSKNIAKISEIKLENHQFKFNCYSFFGRGYLSIAIMFCLKTFSKIKLNKTLQII